jgi:diguanylate cyclase (GGDEF)-like protein/PAS domain S-box-containing protein
LSYQLSIIYVILFFLAIALFILAWPRRKSPGGVFLLAHLICLSEWVFCQFFESIAATAPAKILWSQLCYLGFTTATPFFFLFVLAFVTQTKIKPGVIAEIMIIPVFTILAAFTNQWHHLLWTGFHWGSLKYNVLVYEHGILFFAHAVYIYILVFFVMALIIQKIFKTNPPFRSQLILIAIGGLFPIISGALYVFNADFIPGFDISSFGFILTNLFLALGFSRFQLLDLVPVARDTLIKQFHDGMIVIDSKNRIVEMNQAARKLLRVMDNNPLGKNFRDFLPCEIDLEKFNRDSLPSEICFDKENDIYYDVQVSSLSDNASNPSGYLLVLRDISIRKQTEIQLKLANDHLYNQIVEVNHLQELLKEQATHDSLTKLHNRRLMDEVLNQLLEQSDHSSQPFSLVVMDIDHFKNINDDFGHQTGDLILEAVGKCIMQSTRTNDFSCRLGGDEILIAFQNMSEDKAKIKAEIIREEIQSIETEAEKQLISITVSIGVATYPADGKSINEVIYWADQAMYLAKDKGGNLVKLASEAQKAKQKKNEQMVI